MRYLSSNTKGRFECEAPECYCDKSLRYATKIKLVRIPFYSQKEGIAVSALIGCELGIVIGILSVASCSLPLWTAPVAFGVFYSRAVTRKSHLAICIDYKCEVCDKTFSITYDATSDKGIRRKVGHYTTNRIRRMAKSYARHPEAFIDKLFRSMPIIVDQSSSKCNIWAITLYKLIK